MEQESNWGGWMVFFGAVLWSLNAPLVKLLTLDPMLICGLRALIAALTLLVTLRPKQLVWHPGWMAAYLFSYAGLCIGIIQAFRLTSAPIAIGMQYTAPIWLFCAACIQTKQVNLRVFFPVLIISVGVLCFMSSGSSWENQLGNWIALTEGGFFGLMTVSGRRVAGKNPLGLTALANAFTSLLVFLFFPHTLSGLSGMTGQDWAILLFLGAIQVGGGYSLYTMGVQRISPQRASMIALWEMILGPVWVAVVLKEYPQPVVLLGFLIILAGMVLEGWLHRDHGSTHTKNPKSQGREMWKGGDG